MPEVTICDVNECLKDAIEKEIAWQKEAIFLLNKETIESGDTVTWASFHASFEEQHIDSAIISLLPLFKEKTASVSMMRHGMDIQRNITAYLNPGQLPVIAVDQPLLAIAKSIQWQWPEIYGENQMIVMFGGLDLEMAFWKTIGDFLDQSG